jgi:hypothetical protein
VLLEPQAAPLVETCHGVVITTPASHLEGTCSNLGYRAVWCTCNALDFYSEGTRFGYREDYCYSNLGFLVYSSVSPANDGVIP